MDDRERWSHYFMKLQRGFRSLQSQSPSRSNQVLGSVWIWRRSLPVLQDVYGLFLPCLGCTLTEDFHLPGDHTNKTCEDSKMAHAVFGWEKLKRTSLLTSLGCSPQKAYQSPPTKGPRNQRFPPFCFGAGNLSLAFHCLLELYNCTYIYIKILVYKCGRYSFIYLLWLRNGTTGTIAISLNWIFLKFSAPAPHSRAPDLFCFAACLPPWADVWQTAKCSHGFGSSLSEPVTGPLKWELKRLKTQRQPVLCLGREDAFCVVSRCFCCALCPALFK